MNWKRILTALPLIACALIASAQSEPIPVKDWRVQQGDNLAWAQPDFDDSQWKPTAFPDTDPLFHEVQGFNSNSHVGRSRRSSQPQGRPPRLRENGAVILKPAAEIADAAQLWGQEDDITVLTVTRMEAPA